MTEDSMGKMIYTCSSQKIIILLKASWLECSLYGSLKVCVLYYTSQISKTATTTGKNV
jgi:hypothetical protein